MKVCGFIRLAPIYPGPVIPVFQGIDGDINIQVIDSNGLIIGFGEATDIPKDRFFLKSQQSYPEASIGEEAIFAIETAEKEVSLRRVSKYEELLRRFISDDWVKRSPFVAFEIARALNDEAALRKAAEHCLSKLSVQSGRLAKRWVEASVENSVIRDELIEIANSSIQASEHNREHLHYVAPQYILSLIDRSAARNKKSRAAWIRHAFNPKMIEIESIKSSVPLICDALVKRYEQSDATERSFMTWYRTKGKMPISDSTADLFKRLDGIAQPIASNSKSFEFLTIVETTNFSKGLFTSFIFLIGIYQADRKVIEDIKNVAVSQMLDRNVYNNVRGVLETTKRI